MDPMENINNAADALRQVAERGGSFWDIADDKMDENQSAFDAWRADRDTLGEPGYQGALRVGVLQGQIHNTGGGVVAPNAIGTHHFAQHTIDAGTSTNVYMHVKTPYTFAAGSRKFAYDVSGYAYGNGTVIDGKIVGFMNSGTSTIQAMETIGTHGLTAYKAADDRLTLRMLFPSTYLVDFRLDALHVGFALPALGSFQPIFSTLGAL